MLAAAMSIICGIARSVHADDIAANLVSMHCLFKGKVSRTKHYLQIHS
jgi:hypothetical protein